MRSHRHDNLWLPVILVLVAILSDGTSFVHSAECDTYGCRLIAADVAFDESTKNAMKVLHEASGDPQSPDFQQSLQAMLSSGDDQSVILTLKSYKGGPPQSQINQDSATLIRPFKVRDNSKDDEEAFFLGVFDGHGRGGEIVSSYASKEIPKRVAEKLKNKKDPGDALRESFLEVDQTDPTKGAAGSTATCILRIGKKIFIANTGDSSSFVAARVGMDGTHVAFSAKHHLPSDPEEKKRIEAAGGFVGFPSDPDRDVPRAYHIDPSSGQPLYGLAMSRAIGDHSVTGVIADPTVTVLDVHDLVTESLDAYKEFCTQNGLECKPYTSKDVSLLAVAASDGLMDYAKDEDVAYVLGESFFGESDKKRHPLLVGQDLILHAAEAWAEEQHGRYRDDITLVALALDSPSSSKNRVESAKDEL